MHLIQKSPEVFMMEGDIAIIGNHEVNLLKNAVAQTPRGRVRINIHSDVADALHEMFIAIQLNTYVRPHKHLTKSEAFHMIYGTGDVVIFNDSGEIIKVITLEAHAKNKPFYYRMSKPYFHTLIVRSELMIVHEITNGPFIPGQTTYATFAPPEQDVLAAKQYQVLLNSQIEDMYEAKY